MSFIIFSCISNNPPRSNCPNRLQSVTIFWYNGLCFLNHSNVLCTIFRLTWKFTQFISAHLTVKHKVGKSVTYLGKIFTICWTLWVNVTTWSLKPVVPELGLIYTCITGDALAVSISSFWVKFSNSSCTALGIYLTKLSRKTFICQTSCANKFFRILICFFSWPSFIKVRTVTLNYLLPQRQMKFSHLSNSVILF